MKINEDAFKQPTQCIVGYIGHKPAVLWLNIDNFKESIKDDIKTISFDEDGISYTYVGSKETGYAEAKNKAPAITSYELLNDKEVAKRGYIQQFTNILDIDDEDNFFYNEDEDDEYYDSDAWSIHCGTSYHCGCGSHGRYGCGGGGYGSCGGGGC